MASDPSGPQAPADLAWALKAECHAAWNVDPERACRAADRLAELAAAHPDTPPLQALAHWTAALAALVRGDMADAVRLLDDAAALFLAQGDAQHAAETQVPRMMALSMLGRHDEAVACAATARDQFIAAGDDRSAGKVELNLGSLLLHQDRYADAARQYQRAAVHFARAGDVEHSIMADIALATTQTSLFDFEAARMTHERALKRATQRGYTVLEGLATGALGELELLAGHLAPALRRLKRAVDLLAEHGAPQRRLHADRALADTYLAVRLLPEALALYERVAAQADALQAPVEAAWAHVRRAQALQMLGRPGLAAQALDAAHDGFTRTDNAVGQGVVALQWARLDRQRGDWPAATAHARAAAATLDAAGLAGWAIEAGLIEADALAAQGESAAARDLLDTLHQRAQDLPQQADCEQHLAARAEADGDTARALTHWRAAVRRLSRSRADLPDESMRIAFGADSERAFDALVRLAPDDDPAALLRAMEQGRARALREALGRADAAGPDTRARDAVSEDLRLRWQWLQSQWHQASAGGDAERAAALVGPLRQAEQAWVERQRARAIEAGVGVADATDDFDPAALVDRLPADTALVSWHLDGGGWRAVVATRAGLRAFRGPLADATGQIEQLRFQIEAPRFRPAALRQHDQRLLQRVQVHLRRWFDDLIAPLAPALADTTRWVMVPHRALHHLPWAALHDGTGFLAQSVETTVAPSAAVWLAGLGSAPAAPPRQPLLVGSHAGELGHVDVEVAAVRQALGEASRCLSGAAATVAAVREGAGHADLLHLACHAHARADNPAFSALHLADGQLLLGDLVHAAWPARLVTLSACETAISRVAPGDEVQGLSRGFLAAGVPSVVASLWSVDDVSTAALMADFYRLLGRGRRPGDALRQAQRQAILNNPHPFAWAAFAVHGQG
jgi:tetratricopeptide (TPR) repeat protein